jgi:cyanophycinase
MGKTMNKPVRATNAWAGVGLGLVCFVGAANAGSIYLMGGGYADKNTDLFVNGLRKATGKDASFVPNVNSTSNCGTNWATTSCPRIAIITSSKATYAEGLDSFQNDLGSGANVKRSFYNLFQTHGFSPKFITAHIDNYSAHSYSGNTAGDANIAVINQADVVWFAGGDQAKIARTWFKNDGTDTPLAAALRTRWNNGSGNIVMSGDSAGNHIMNTTMHGGGISYGYIYFGGNLQAKAITDFAQFGDTRDGTTALRYYDNGASMKGFGFLPNTLLSDTHFDSRSGRLGRLIAAQRSIGRTQGFGVDEDTGVLVNTSTQTAKVFGSGTFIISDTSGASFNTTSPMTVSGVRVSLLTSGDTYNYSTKAITSSKSLITSPYYSSFYDSPDIFSAYETSKSITRIVDSSAASNIGTAPRPVYSTNPKYPTGAAAYKVKFTKDSQTKGYFSGGKYTAAKVLVQIY